MSRSFVAASSQYLETSTLPVTAAAFTVAAWILPTSVTVDQTVFSILGSGSVGFYLKLQNTSVVRAQHFDGSANGLADATGTATAGVWAHVAAVFASNSSRTAYRDGANAGTNGTACSTPTVTSMNVGCQNSAGSRSSFFGGPIGEVGLWNVGLDAAEVAGLGAGISPLLVRPTSLLGYWPVLGQYSPEIDLMRANGLTVSGATAAAHPRIYLPAGPLVIAKPAAVAATGQGRMFQVF